MQIQLDLQGVLEKMRRKRKAAAVPLQVIGFYDALLVEIAETGAVRHTADRSGGVQVVIRAYRRLEDLSLPVGIGITQQGAERLAVVCADRIGVDKFPELRRRQDVLLFDQVPGGDLAAEAE